MKFCCGIVAGLLVLCSLCPSARAGAEIYLLGGPGLDDVKGDTGPFGSSLARAVGRQFDGFWTAEEKPRVGLDVGVGARYELPVGLGVAAEVRFLERGARWHFTEQTELRRELDGSLKLEYLEIPLLAQYTLPTPGRVRPTLLIGPVVGIRLSSKIQFGALGFTGPEADLGPGVMKSTYVGALAGAGVRVRTSGRSTLLAQVRVKGQFPNLVRDWVGLKLKPQDYSLLVGFSRAL